MADIVKNIQLDVKTNKKQVDDLINSLKKGLKLDVNLNPIDKKVNSSVNELKDKIDSISGKEIDIKSNIPEVKKDVDDVKKSLSERIELAIDAQKSATSIKDFRNAQKELRGLLLEIGDEGSADFERVAVAIGTGNDKVDELNDKIKSLSKAPIENLSAGFKGVRDSILELNFEEFNDRVKNLNVISKQVSFGDLNKSLIETGKSFATLGKLIATNPLGLLATAVGLLISNFDSLKEVFGPILKQLEFVGQTIEFVTNAFFSLTDAIGLTNKADQEAADKSIAANEKRKKSIQQNLDAQEAYYSATKDLSDEEIKQIEEKTGVIIENEKDILDIRIESAQKVIQANESSLAKLKDLEDKKGKLTDEEVKKRQELENEIKKSNEEIVKSEAERVLKTRELIEKSISDRRNIEIQAISDSNKRALEQAKFDKEQREASIDINGLEASLNEARDKFEAKQKEIEQFKIKGLLTGDFAAKKEAELNQLKVSLDNAKTLFENGNKQRLASDEIYENQTKDIRRKAREDAAAEAQRVNQDRLKALTDESQIIINTTKEGTAERLAAEIELSKKTEGFIKSKGKLLGLTEAEITLRIQEETGKRIELEQKYNDEVIRLSNEKKIAKLNIDLLEAKTLEDRIKANTALIEEGARQEIEELRKTIDDKELLALKEREINIKKNADISASNIKLESDERQLIIETGLLRIQNDIKSVDNLKKTTDQRISEVNRLFEAEKAALKEREKLEIAAAEGDEIKIAEIRERYRGLRLDAEKKLEDDIKNIRLESQQVLEGAVDNLNAFLQTTSGLTTQLGASINDLVGGIANSIPNLFKVINDETATTTEKTLAYLQTSSAAIAGIGQVLSAISNQRIQEIQTEEEAAVAASEREYNSQLQYINQNIKDESERRVALEQLEVQRNASNDNLRKKYAKIELDEKRKAFNQQKAISLTQTVISTAQAVVTALTAGPIVGPILAGIAGSLGAVQLALIASQKFPEGGSAPSGGGGGIGGFTGGGGEAPSPTPFQAPQFFGIGNQSQNTGNQPPQPIIIENNIVETDITSTQRNINTIETRAQIV